MCAHKYIGKTERILAHRIKKHNSKNKSIELAYQSHKKENQTHIIDASVIEIIDKADNNFKLMLKEMLHINKLKPIFKSLTMLCAHYYNTPTSLNIHI
jgi:hypothetical protein